jgi:hypothetical protein
MTIDDIAPDEWDWTPRAATKREEAQGAKLLRFFPEWDKRKCVEFVKSVPRDTVHELISELQQLRGAERRGEAGADVL